MKIMLNYLDRPFRLSNLRYERANNTIWTTNDQTMNKKFEKERIEIRLNYGIMKIINDM
jgi:hypothetical protein